MLDLCQADHDLRKQALKQPLPHSAETFLLPRAFFLQILWLAWLLFVATSKTEKLKKKSRSDRVEVVKAGMRKCLGSRWRLKACFIVS